MEKVIYLEKEQNTVPLFYLHYCFGAVLERVHRHRVTNRSLSRYTTITLPERA